MLIPFGVLEGLIIRELSAS